MTSDEGGGWDEQAASRGVRPSVTRSGRDMEDKVRNPHGAQGPKRPGARADGAGRAKRSNSDCREKRNTAPDKNMAIVGKMMVDVPLGFSYNAHRHKVQACGGKDRQFQHVTGLLLLLGLGLLKKSLP